MSPYSFPGIVRNSLTVLKDFTINSVKDHVSKNTGIPIERMEARTRKREVVEARQISMYLCKHFTTESLRSIAESFGGRDHTTCIHSIATIKDLMDSDEYFKDRVNNMRDSFAYDTIKLVETPVNAS